LARRGLLVSYYFPPTGGGGVQRWAKLIKYLSRYGWEFTIIAHQHVNSSPKDETLLDEIPRNAKIIRTPYSSTGMTSQIKALFFSKSGYWQRWASAFFHITDSRKSWNNDAARYIVEELKNHAYNVIIFTSPPYSLAFLASEIKKKVNCPVLLDLRDPWTINPYKIYPTKLHRFLDQRREKICISKLKVLISAYQSTIDDYQKRVQNFGSKEILILPNGYDEADFRNLDDIEIFQGGAYNIGFSGSVYSHLNTPHPIFKAIYQLKKEGLDIHFHHIGSSVYDLAKLAQKYKIEENIHLWGYTDHKTNLRLLQKMDALCLILDDHWPRSESTIGGKIYEYLRLKIPIFAIVPANGEAARLIKDTNSGITMSAKKEENIIENLKRLVLDKQKFTWNGIEKFNRERQAKVLSDFLDSLI
jgi:glycosyltransferase involved in cell wall biosynthesis